MSTESAVGPESIVNAPSNANEVVSDQLKFRSKEYSHPKYKLSQLYPLSGSQTQTINAAGSQEIIFQLPVKCMNLSKSVLSYTMRPADYAGDDGDNVFFTHKSPLTAIRQIQLYTQGGVYLCDLYNVNKYLNVVYFAETDKETFSTNEIRNNTSISNYGIYAHQNGRPAPIATIPLGSYNYSSRVVTNAAGAVQAVDAVGTTAVGQFERIYFEPGTLSPADPQPDPPTPDPVINIQFPMKYLYNTIFDIDKDMFFGEVLQLRIVFDGRDATYFQAEATNDATNAEACSQDINVTNIAFYTAVEQDQNIVNSIVKKFNTEGITIPIPYVYTYKTNLSSTSQSLSLRFNKAHGKKLRRIYHAPFHNVENSVTAYMRDNIGGAKTVSNFYTLLNNDRLQEFNVDCSKAQDYMLLNHKLKNSTFVGVDSYQYVWFWVDDFTSEKPLSSPESKDIFLSSGIDLSAEQKWDIYMTTANNRALNHYNFAITEKELLIRPGAIQVQ